MGFSLLRTGTPYSVIALIPQRLSSHRPSLSSVFSSVTIVEPVANPNPSAQIAKASYTETYTKLRVWQQTQYNRVVFVDADMVFVKSVDDLFELPHSQFYAAEECCGFFNSGLMVLSPSAATFSDMLAKTRTLNSIDGADGGFLNAYYARDWRPLSWEYNAMQATFFSPAYQRTWRAYQDRIRAIHYLQWKPWKGENEKGLLDEVQAPWFHAKTELEEQEKKKAKGQQA